MAENLDVKWKKAVVEIAQEFKKSNKLKGLELEDALKRKLEALDLSEQQKRTFLKRILKG